MSYKKLLTHRCDIYHLKERSVGVGGNYGVPDDDFQKEFYYDDEPDSDDVRSYFVANNQTVIQAEPNQIITEIWDVHFLKSTDIKMNDKVVWDGVAYTARKPRTIKNHHIEITVFRSENV